MGLVGIESCPGVLDEEPLDEVLCLGGDGGPVLVGEHEASLLDAGEKPLLAIGARLPPIPSAVEAAVASKGGVAAQEDVHDHPQAPEVALLVVADALVVVVVVVVNQEGVNNLRGHVLQTSPRAEKGWGDGGVNADRCGAEVKITKLDRTRRVAVHAKNVVRLEVPVRDALLVQVLQSPGQVLYD